MPTFNTRPHKVPETACNRSMEHLGVFSIVLFESLLMFSANLCQSIWDSQQDVGPYGLQSTPGLKEEVLKTFLVQIFQIQLRVRHP